LKAIQEDENYENFQVFTKSFDKRLEIQMKNQRNENERNERSFQDFRKNLIGDLKVYKEVRGKYSRPPPLLNAPVKGNDESQRCKSAQGGNRRRYGFDPFLTYLEKKYNDRKDFTENFEMVKGVDERASDRKMADLNGKDDRYYKNKSGKEEIFEEKANHLRPKSKKSNPAPSQSSTSKKSPILSSSLQKYIEDLKKNLLHEKHLSQNLKNQIKSQNNSNKP
jgi:hypothetical protein